MTVIESNAQIHRIFQAEVPEIQIYSMDTQKFFRLGLLKKEH